MNRKLFEIKMKSGLENRWLCVDWRPAYEYVNEKKTEKVIGTVYSCLHAQVLSGGLYDIKVIGEKPCIQKNEIADNGCPLTFDGLTFNEWTDSKGTRRTSGRASHAMKA